MTCQEEEEIISQFQRFVVASWRRSSKYSVRLFPVGGGDRARKQMYQNDPGFLDVCVWNVRSESLKTEKCGVFLWHFAAIFLTAKTYNFCHRPFLMMRAHVATGCLWLGGKRVYDTCPELERKKKFSNSALPLSSSPPSPRLSSCLRRRAFGRGIVRGGKKNSE